MIKSWKNKTTEKLANGQKVSGFGSLDVNILAKRLAVLNAATVLKDIPPLKSVNLHALKGNRAGQWAINVNGAWRICFKFKDGHAFDVEIVDYH
jgi:proteic killer suppression protein